MPTTATSQLRQARASAPSGEDIWQTLELSHPLWPSVVYLTNAARPFDATLDSGATVTFQSYPFALVLPTVDGAGNQQLQVTLTNADPQVRQLVERAKADPTTRIVAVYREYLSDAPGVQGPPLRLSFDTLAINDQAVTGTANRSDVLNRRFPGIWYDVAHFPGLDR